MSKKLGRAGVLPGMLAAVVVSALVVVGCPPAGPPGDGTVDVTGRWIQTDPCDPLMIFDLTQIGQTVTGVASETTGAVLGPLTGTITNASLSLELTLPMDHWFQYELTVSGSTMSGTWTSSSGMSGNLNMEKTA